MCTGGVVLFCVISFLSSCRQRKYLILPTTCRQEEDVEQRRIFCVFLLKPLFHYFLLNFAVSFLCLASFISGVSLEGLSGTTSDRSWNISTDGGQSGCAFEGRKSPAPARKMSATPPPTSLTPICLSLQFSYNSIILIFKWEINHVFAAAAFGLYDRWDFALKKNDVSSFRSSCLLTQKESTNATNVRYLLRPYSSCSFTCSTSRSC